MDFLGRRHRMSEALREHGADAFLAWSEVSLRYLTGFGESAHERFLALALGPGGEMRLICPALSATQAARAGITDLRTWSDGEDPLAHFAELAQDWNLRSSILAVDSELPAHMLLKMQEVLPAALFKDGAEILSSLRRVKAPEELDRMRRAGRMADDALAAGLAVLHPGATERQVADALRSAMKHAGGEPTFCIVAAGANAAEPHHLTDDTPLQSGDVVILDFGCDVEGYQSDITRTVCVGRASEEAKSVYRLVWEAHEAGRAAIRPGVEAQDVDAAARRVIEEAGYGQAFFHRLGHGIGMQGHEAPNLVAGNTHLLEVGNCFSVEPGIYLSGRFGVRIENIVTVTEDGHASLNEEPSPHLLEIG